MCFARISPYYSVLRLGVLVLITTTLLACSGASLKEDIVRDLPSFSRPPATEGRLAEMSTSILTEHGTDASGFILLDSSYDGLAWRLAIIDNAVSSVDVMTYLWYPDFSGRLVLDRVVHAAQRGVKVRLVVDDLLTIGLDQVLYELQQHPNIEMRIFNPWQDRNLLSRGGEMLIQMERLNTRMHDKLLIADGHAAVVGGRNIGDHYFGLSDAYNFHDLDLLGMGEVAEQAGGMFDHFWNSEWVISTANIDIEPDPEFARETLANIREIIATAPELESFPRLPADWRAELDALPGDWHIGTSQLIYDETAEGEITQNVYAELFGMMDIAQEELLITNAYIIPGQSAIDFVQTLSDRGVDVGVLTNSLESHDVPAVNSHYRGWRDDLIEAGVDVFELRADADIQAEIVEVPPVKGEFTGLHTKAFVADQRHSFIGSMNFDPRSASINTEAGVFIDSPGLGQELAALMRRDMTPENSWQVKMDEDGDMVWVNSDTTVDTQPARDFGQRIMDKIFRIFPKEQY